MIRVELRKLVRRPRTWLTLLLLNALPVLVAVLVSSTDLAPRPGSGPAFLSAVLANGQLFAVAALAIVLPLFLPIAVAVIAGDSVAGEAQGGTLRYLLARPVGRTRLLVAKLVMVLTFTALAVVLVTGVGLLTGEVLLGHGTAPAGASIVSVSGSPAQPGPDRLAHDHLDGLRRPVDARRRRPGAVPVDRPPTPRCRRRSARSPF